MSPENQNLNFEWDPRKAAMNVRKHGVTFSEATTVFADLNQLSIYDAAHSVSEDRWITMGVSGTGRILIVCHTFRENGLDIAVRIFSSRKATKQEAKWYTRLI